MRPDRNQGIVVRGHRLRSQRHRRNGNGTHGLADVEQLRLRARQPRVLRMRGDEIFDQRTRVIESARLARAAGLQVALNAAPAQALPLELMAMVNLLIVNEGELRTISQSQGSIVDAMAVVPCHTVVVTLGARGAVARQGEHLHYQCGFAVQAVDTTGAGDTFCGVLIAQLASGQAMAQALQFSGAAAALCCTKPGAQSSVPENGEVRTFLAGRSAHDTSALQSYCTST